MSKVVYQEHDIRNTLVCYIAGALSSEKPFTTKSWHGDKCIPNDRDYVYTEEDVKDLECMMFEGSVHSFLHKAEGWRKLRILKGRLSYDAKDVYQRLLSACSDVAMGYDGTALDLIEAFYNLTSTDVRRGNKEVYQKSIERMSYDSSELGSHALSFWLYTQLNRTMVYNLRGCYADLQLPAESNVLDNLCSSNPMMMLAYGPWSGASLEGYTEKVESFLESKDNRGLMPWWIPYCLDIWMSREDQLWGMEHEEFSSARSRQVLIARAWMDAISGNEWFHLYRPFVEYYHNYMHWTSFVSLEGGKGEYTLPRDDWRECEEALRPDLVEFFPELVDKAFSKTKLSIRQTLKDLTASLFLSSNIIEASLRECISIPPADRSKNEIYMVDMGDELGVKELCLRMKTISTILENRS